MDEEIIIRIPIKKFLKTRWLSDFIDQKIEGKLQTMKQEQTLTRKQMARMYQVSQQTIDRLTDEELEDRGYKRIKVGVSVRFQRIVLPV